MWVVVSEKVVDGEYVLTTKLVVVWLTAVWTISRRIGGEGTKERGNKECILPPILIISRLSAFDGSYYDTFKN